MRNRKMPLSWPMATIPDFPSALGLQQNAGWGFQILPYLEAENTWRGGNKSTIRECVLTAVGTPNPMYLVP
jgi:hypothetical protein